MGMPPAMLKSGWNFERYNAAMMAALGAEPEWTAYKKALDAARIRGAADGPQLPPPYPEALVRRVQKRVNEVATAALGELQLQLARLQVADTGVGIKRGRLELGPRPAADYGDDEGSFSRRMREKRERRQRREAGLEIDPDYLTAAFEYEFKRAWSMVYDTMRAMNIDEVLTSDLKTVSEAFRGQRDDAYEDSTEVEDAAQLHSRLADRASTIYEMASDTFREEKTQVLARNEAWEVKELLPNQREYVVSEYEEKLVKEYALLTRGGQYNGNTYTTVEEKKRDYDALMAKINELVPTLRQRDVLERSQVRAWRDQAAEIERKMNGQEARIITLNALLANMRADQPERAQTATKKFSIQLVGKGLLHALAYDIEKRARGAVNRSNQLRDIWNSLVRAFHLPASGDTYGGRGEGEIDAYALSALAQRQSLEHLVCYEVFDVGVIPTDGGSLFGALRIYGRRFMSDPMFVRTLITLSRDVAGLDAGALQSREDAAANLHKSWSVRAGKTVTKDGLKRLASGELRKRAFLVCVEVAARRVRAMVGEDLNIAPSKDSPKITVPPQFERYRAEVSEHVPKLIDWRLEVRQPLGVKGLKMRPIDGTGGTIGMVEVVPEPATAAAAAPNQLLMDNSAMWLGALHNSLLLMLRSMAGTNPGFPEANQLADPWAHETAKNLCMPAVSLPKRSRRIAFANKPGRYGLKGEQHPVQVVEFHVKSLDNMRSERALGEIFKYQQGGVFSHLCQNVLHTYAPSYDPLLQLFLEDDSLNVALCFHSCIDFERRYQVLFKDPRQRGKLVLIDPSAEPLSKAMTYWELERLESRSRAATGQTWTTERMGAFRDRGDDDEVGFLTALARALVLALAAKRVATNAVLDAQEYGALGYPILGTKDFDDPRRLPKVYDELIDYASATSDLTWGFGPMCLSLAAIVHNQTTIGQQAQLPAETQSASLSARRVELWDMSTPFR